MAKKTKKSKDNRFLPGTLVMQKDTRQHGVVQYSYADEFGGDDYESLSIMWLKDGDQKGHCSAWHNASDFVEVPFEEMIALYLKVMLSNVF
ncbi:hypothetical protein [Lachnospira sp.]|jgi:hypothetical protein|uniref:hypothetical protein n=1 Tax=Lachnospira sp. TaxID=2049031 RepID=UPI00257C1D47|nr:hypothetical protein [Lachnospira sp.]